MKKKYEKPKLKKVEEVKASVGAAHSNTSEFNTASSY